jgi:hypothetical protein
MRKLNAWALATAALFLAPQALSAQSLSEAAAKEKQRRKAVKGGKSYTEDDLGRPGGGTANIPPADETAAAAPKEGEGGEADKKKEDEKSPDELKAEANAAWRKKMDVAQQNVQTYQEAADRIQRDLNDTSGGFYGARRTTMANLLTETQQKLADAQQQVADLEAEGRRNGYR